MKILIDIPAEEYRWICESDKTWAANTVSKECMMNAIKRGAIIGGKENPTNGDVMEAIYKPPKIYLKRYAAGFYATLDGVEYQVFFERGWWDGLFTNVETTEE